MKQHRAQSQLPEPDANDERPPFGRSWTTLYLIVLVNLVVLIVFFHLFTRAFS